MLWRDADARVKSESPPRRPSDTTWESYPGAVSPTLLVGPSRTLWGSCAGRPVSTPWHYAAHSCTACTPHPSKGGRWNPRKGYGGLPRARAGRRRDVGPVERVSSISSGLARPSPPLCSHLGHRSVIPSAVGAQDDKTPPSPPMYVLRPSVSYTLESAYGRRLKWKAPTPLPSNRSWTGTGLTATPRQKQDSPGRPSTPWHCAPYRHT
jgi:hypothetical protein